MAENGHSLIKWNGLMRRRVSSLLTLVGLAIVAAAPGQSRAADLTTLVSFCALPNCADGFHPASSLIADAHRNLFATTWLGGNGLGNFAGTVFEIVKTDTGYASTPTTLVRFCSLPVPPPVFVAVVGDCIDGAAPVAALIADAEGNLLGTTQSGGANAGGTVFEIVKTDTGYASSPTILYSFCSLSNCSDGLNPVGALIADASGNLFGTTRGMGTSSEGGSWYGLQARHR